MWWILTGFILYITLMLYTIFIENEEITITEAIVNILVALAFGPLYLLLIIIFGIVQLDKKGVKIKKPSKKEKKTEIDSALFEGDEKVYNDFHERFKEKLKEFKE